MFRRLAAIAVLAIAVPVMAYGWSLNTWVKSSGGTITVNGVSQSVTNGSVFKTYTGSLSNTSASQNPTVSFTVPAGYTANYSYTNNTGTLNTVANAIAGTVFSQVFSNANVNSGSGLAELYVTFETTFQSASVTGTTDSNITMYPASMNVAVGSAVGTPGPTFTFTTKPGYVINTITASDPAIIIPAIPANATTLKVVLPYKYVFTSAGLQFSATSTGSATVSIPNAGAPQTFTSVPATVTLNGGVIGNQTVAFKNWSCVSWPTGATQPFAKTSTNPVTFTPAAGVNGSYTFIYRISNTQAAETFVTIAPATTVSNLVEGRNCQACHTQNGIGNANAAGQSIYVQYSSGNTHKNSSHSLCSACHYGTGNGGHPGTVNYASVNPSTFLVNVANINAGGPGPGGEGVPSYIATPGAGVVFCEYCHNSASPYGVPGHVNTPLNAGVTCVACHTDPLGQGNGTGDIHAVQPLPSCTSCHAVAQPQVNASLINDNNGVRAITGEFSKWSHHVTGRAVQDSDCATCHMEGSVSGGVVSVNAAYHMADDYIHLRNCNVSLTANQSRVASANIEAKSGGSASTGTVGAGTVQYLWNPDSATPDYTAMDQFCMSCHNSGGAPDAVAAVGGANPLATALNPFGDTISNQYDQILRPAVVAVFDQFAPGNTSHHGVRANKYTATTLPAATFTAISTANAAPATAAAGQSLGIKPSIGTMSSLGKMNTLYTPLGATAGSLADNSTLHCGDCHTVGQNKPNATVNSAGTAITQVIGAHGSDNEYLLRKPNGIESHNFSNNSTASTLPNLASQNNLVCYLCHNAASYQPGDSHDGIGPCVADAYNTPGLVGHTRLAAKGINLAAVGGSLTVPAAYTPAAYTNISTLIAAGHYGTNGGANIFGNKCLNCHNGAPTNNGKLNAGGIHGNQNNFAYQSFSSATSPYAAQIVNRPSYRFLSGLGNIGYNGGNNPGNNPTGANSWTMKTLRSVNASQGCYTLTGTTTNTSAVYAAVKAGGLGSGKTPANAITTDNGVLGSWGACSDHSGSSTSAGSGSDAPSRTVIRPLSY